jgi:membrane fusion protein (multidrug efflux system)
MRARLLLSIALLVAPACGGEAGAGGPGGPGGPGKRRGGGESEPLAVAVTQLEPATIERFYRGAGTLEALRVADLVALQPGVVLELKAEEGDAVAENELLARLDGRAFQLQAARDRLNAQNAASELARLEQLKELLPREELDRQRYAAESALASAKVSKHQAAQTTLAAPFSGTITRRHIDIGNLANTSTKLYTIADLSALDLELHVPERDAATVQPGAPARLELQDGSGFQAKVERRAPVVDPLTGTVKFTIRAREFPAAAVPGAFVRAALRVDVREAAPSLPRSAIVEVEGKPHVYLVEDGRARRRPVELGVAGDERVEIRGGLAPDATVVVDAGTGITEGMPVRSMSPEAGPEGKAPADRAEKTGPEGKAGNNRWRRGRPGAAKGQGPAEPAKEQPAGAGGS